MDALASPSAISGVEFGGTLLPLVIEWFEDTGHLHLQFRTTAPADFFTRAILAVTGTQTEPFLGTVQADVRPIRLNLARSMRNNWAISACFRGQTWSDRPRRTCVLSTKTTGIEDDQSIPRAVPLV